MKHNLLQSAGNQFRVYPIYCLKKAGKDPREDQRIKKWMDGYNLFSSSTKSTLFYEAFNLSNHILLSLAQPCYKYSGF